MSDKSLQVTGGQAGDLIVFNDDKVSLIKRTIAKDATDTELDLFLHQCKRTGLDPLAKQIYFQKYNGQMAIITGIDGYRLIADRTGKYAGNDDAVFEGQITATAKDGQDKYPAKAAITVWKIVAGAVRPFSASAYWKEYYPGDGPRGRMWRRFPHVMLAKCAESLALRKAFPADLSGIYTAEEIEQAATEVIDVPAGNGSAPGPSAPGPSAADVNAAIVQLKRELESPALARAVMGDTPAPAEVVDLAAELGAEVVDVPAEVVDVPAEPFDVQKVLVDGQSWLEDKARDGQITVGLVCDCAVMMVPAYETSFHSEGAAKKWAGWPDGFEFKTSRKIYVDTGVKLYRWLVERKSEVE